MKKSLTACPVCSHPMCALEGSTCETHLDGTPSAAKVFLVCAGSTTHRFYVEFQETDAGVVVRCVVT